MVARLPTAARNAIPIFYVGNKITLIYKKIHTQKTAFGGAAVGSRATLYGKGLMYKNTFRDGQALDGVIRRAT